MNRDDILFGINGMGLGHVSRTLKIVKQLNKTYNVYITTYGDAYGYLKRSRMPVKTILLPELSVEWGTDGLSIGKTVMKLLYKHSLTFIKHLHLEKNIIKNIKPKLIISDSRLSTLVCARHFNIPSLLITNQIVIQIPETIPAYKYLDFLSENFFPKFWGIADNIIVCDMPPPFTISYKNIIPALIRENHKMIFIGILDDIDKYESSINTIKYDVYIAISGPRRDRIVFSKRVLSVIKDLSSYGSVIISLGEKGSRNLFYRKNRGKTRVSIYGWIENKLDVLKKCGIVVLRGGQTSVLEAILMLKPMIVIPAYGQTEQMENGKNVRRLGLGELIDPIEFVHVPMKIVEKAREILKNYDYYLRNLKRVRTVLVRCGGIKKAMDIIKNYLN